jgi:pimeloyl-ACP methyl ester carboxylesterase
MGFHLPMTSDGSQAKAEVETCFAGGVMSSPRGTRPGKAVNWAEKIQLGETKQWVLARGSDVSNPVLLILAGGPGGTETGWFRRYNAALEEHFTVVHWEQRGAGKSSAFSSPIVGT